MGKGDNLLHCAPDKGVGLPGNGCGHIVDTAHRRNDPDLVAHPHLAVRALETHKGHILRPVGFRWRLPCVLHRRHRLIAVLQQISQRRTHIVGMDPGPCGNLFFGIADTIAILEDFPACGNITHRHFMPGGNFLPGSDPTLPAGYLHRDGLPLGDGVQGHHHIVVVIYFYEILHTAALIPFSFMSSRYAVTASVSPGTWFKSCPWKSSLPR